MQRKLIEEMIDGALAGNISKVFHELFRAMEQGSKMDQAAIVQMQHLKKTHDLMMKHAAIFELPDDELERRVAMDGRPWKDVCDG